MTYTVLPDLSTGDDISPSDWTAWIDGNFDESPAVKALVRGDMFIGTGLQSMAILPVGTAGQIIESDDTTPTGLKNSWAFIPVGGIIMWSGVLGSLPSNWQLCDGTNGTPDLRDEFVIGAGGAYAVGANADATDLTHTHTISGTLSAGGSHTHSQPDTGGSVGHWHSGTTGASDNNILVYRLAGWRDAASAVHTHTFETTSETTHTHPNPSSSAATHTHSITSIGTGLTAPEKRPPYYALAYIMRMS